MPLGSGSPPFSEQREERRLWQEWFSDRNIENRNHLFDFYEKWMVKMASVFFSRYSYPLSEWSDYVQYCALGLMDAIEKFQPNAGAKFETYAYIRLKGELLNGLKTLASHPCVSEFSITNSIVDEYASDVDDPFDVLFGVTVDLALDRILSVRSSFSNDAYVSNNPLDVYSKYETGAVLTNLVKQLGEDEALVIDMYYEKQVKYKVIAEYMGVSVSRVSQIHKNAIRQLRRLYESLHG